MVDFKKKYGPWALITGASAGIGAAFARELAARKMNLVLIARREAQLQQLAGELKQAHGIETLVLPLDLTDEKFVDQIKAKTAQLDLGLIVNNAGFGNTGLLIDNDTQQEVQMVKLNCLATLLLAHHFCRVMAARQRGALVFLSSVAANQPNPYGATYAATKSFDLQLGAALWFEMKMKGVDVVTVLPGTTNTEFQKVSGYKQNLKGRRPQDVVHTAFKALGKKPVVTDGASNKILTFMTRLLPRKLAIKLAADFVLQNRAGGAAGK